MQINSINNIGFSGLWNNNKIFERGKKLNGFVDNDVITIEYRPFKDEPKQITDYFVKKHTKHTSIFDDPCSNFCNEVVCFDTKVKVGRPLDCTMSEYFSSQDLREKLAKEGLSYFA